MLLSATNFGAVIGGITSGFLVRSVPYWYLWASALVFHTVAFIIHCLSYQGWLIMISRLLAGYFVGAITTLSFAYFTMSSEAYVKVKKDLGEEKASFRVRNYLFSTISIGFSAGLIIASGKCRLSLCMISDVMILHIYIAIDAHAPRCNNHFCSI